MKKKQFVKDCWSRQTVGPLAPQLAEPRANQPTIANYSQAQLAKSSSCEFLWWYAALYVFAATFKFRLYSVNYCLSIDPFLYV